MKIPEVKVSNSCQKIYEDLRNAKDELDLIDVLIEYKDDRRLIKVIEIIAEEATDKETRRLFRHMVENIRKNIL